VGDGGAEGRFGRRAHRVDVNPLVVAGCIGEEVDLFLRDLHPLADGDLLADPLLQFFEAAYLKFNDGVTHWLAGVRLG
jgi:hypothetical protein